MRITYALWFTMLFLLAIWGVYALNEMLELGWRKHGMHPRQWDGLRGIFTYPFLHGDLGHLWNNTMSYFTLNGFLFYFYRRSRSGSGCGSSCAGPLALGPRRGQQPHRRQRTGLRVGSFPVHEWRHPQQPHAARVSLAVAFLYGGIVWWMLPIDDTSVEATSAGRLLGWRWPFCTGVKGLNHVPI